MLDTTMEDTPKRKITREDLMPLDEYAKIRRQHKATLVEKKQRRRIHIGPHITLYFENFDTMWAQIQEMLFIEKGGEDQIECELNAYNPLIPQGSELVATMMIEIEDENVRRRTLANLGHIEDMVAISFDGHSVKGTPEDDLERTTAGGKTSSVHFLHFSFTPEQIAAFKKDGAAVTIGIGHPNYGHIAILHENTRAALAQDFD